MRQRIKTIETIKKITHAMRIISMSSRAHLQLKEKSLRMYSHTIEALYSSLAAYIPTWRNPILHPESPTTTSMLVLLVGSQKGLCGTFNTNLFKFFDEKKAKFDNAVYYVIGKKAIEYFMRMHGKP